MFALLNWAATLPKTAAPIPTYSTDYDFGCILNDSLEGNPDVKEELRMALRFVGIELDEVLRFEKANQIIKHQDQERYDVDEALTIVAQEPNYVHHRNAMGTAFFDGVNDADHPSGFGVVWPHVKEDEKFNWMNDEFLSCFSLTDLQVDNLDGFYDVCLPQPGGKARVLRLFKFNV